MPRKHDINKAVQIIETATNIFIRNGYKRSKMEDVTKSLGLSTGSIYRYFKSKEALFDLILRVNIEDIDLGEIKWPLASTQDTLNFLQKSTLLERRFPTLTQSLQQDCTSEHRQQFAQIIGEIYDVLAKYRIGIKLIESSALDWPELAELWFKKRRQQMFTLLTSYIEKSISQGHIPQVVDINASVRFVVNTITFFAIHRHFDIIPTEFDETTSRQMAVYMITRAFCKCSQ
ncbi:TetR/AcrR family transcriptional regulator [Candidatus Uabimicrobium amorphum]|uniref:TetR family transcriptional regulator n=1 Tax=Uabimicrobium amorphum TaxID=2596890 RepID=A0A5S9IUD5_UABAM|nr:TetR/AcrR family transcriptional regulator [Candidatus Uabimicrobium amorphum]BBM88303.1 TetR family transcriptional regulator [Candidatus Uabimicrobium amorphum]